MVFKNSELRSLIRESIREQLYQEVITSTPVADDTQYQSKGAYDGGPFFLPQGIFDFLFGGRGVPGSLYSVVESMFTTTDGWIGLALLAYVFRADIKELERNIEAWIEENYARTAQAITDYDDNIDGGMSQEDAMDLIQEAIKDDTSMLLYRFISVLEEAEILDMLRSLDELFGMVGSDSDRSLESNYTGYFREQNVSGLQAATQEQVEDAIGNIIIPGIYNGMVNRAEQYSTNIADTLGAQGIASRIDRQFEDLYMVIDPYGGGPIIPTLPSSGDGED